MNAPPAIDISVLMTVWNSARYVGEAIDSIVAQQTGYRWELILVDDGSTDDSLAVLQAIQRDHPERILILRHPQGENRGMSASRNLALKQARGRVVAFLDSDDVWLPDHLETQMQALENHPDAAMIYGAAERWCDHAAVFDQQQAERAFWGENYIPPLVPAGERTGLLSPGTLVGWFLADQGKVPCICTVLARTAAVRRIGGFNNRFRGLYEDQVFHTKLSLLYPVYANPVCTARYRLHPDSCSATALSTDKYQASLAFEKWLQSQQSKLDAHRLTRQTIAKFTKPGAFRIFDAEAAAAAAS